MSRYAEVIAHRRLVAGDLSEDNLDPRLIPYYDAGGEVLLRWPDGTVRRGRVAIGNGHAPTFMLMLHEWSMSSSTFLAGDFEILGHKLLNSDVFAPVTSETDLPEITNPMEGVLGDD